MEKYHLLSVESWICDSFNPAWDELYHTFCTSSKVQLAQLQAVWAGNSTTCPDGYATTLNKVRAQSASRVPRRTRKLSRRWHLRCSQAGERSENGTPDCSIVQPSVDMHFRQTTD